MFHIDTASPRWRRLAVASIALPLSFAMSGTALAAEGDDERSSAAVVGLDVSCFAVSATSDKDLSNVKVTFADGSFQEINGLSGDTFTRTFSKQVAFATAKSGTTEVSDQAGACAAPPAEDTEKAAEDDKSGKGEKAVKDAKAVRDDKIAKAVKDAKTVTAAKDEKAAKGGEDDKSSLPTSGQGTAVVSIAVDCDSVKVTSSKDISNVKVTFADGSFLEINGLSGVTFDRTFAKEIAFATAKSATTQVRGEVDTCAVAGEKTPVVEDTTPVVEETTPVVEETTPVVEKAPVVQETAPVVGTTPVVEETAPTCPTTDVMGPVMEGCETPGVTTPINDQPAPQPATDGPVAQTPVEQTPVEQAPVVADETPDQATIGAPIADQTEAQPAVGAAPVAAPAPAPAAAPVAGQPAQAAAGVLGNTAVAPAAVTTVAAPAALPFTGADTDALLQLGAVLVIAGGGALLAGRRERTAKHARTAKHTLLA